MGKKTSKHSRAARRRDIDENEDKSNLISSIPNKNSDVKKSIIRTTIKNENLLNKKMELSKIRKSSDSNKKKSTSLKHKIERSTKISGILANKIDQSIQRAKYVQNARKSDWKKTNFDIEIKNHLANELKVDKVELTQEDLDKMVEDEYVKDFFEITKEDKPKEDKVNLATNKFSILDETEA
ncbi:unnamed protein product [Candida verbasci]|uniref:Uncharacterized protein n=1 Tax=Candida verbasci TaxID=1227364 RepID=A0A9W4TYX5_9ASCO|nr:unnamed protein product [Candida verbasci]